jgi:hypothetical protein
VATVAKRAEKDAGSEKEARLERPKPRDCGRAGSLQKIGRVIGLVDAERIREAPESW